MKRVILKNYFSKIICLYCLFVFNPANSQVVSTIAGSSAGYQDGQGTSAKFNGSAGIVVDANGNLFVADRLNHCIRKITPTGMVSTFAGSGIAGFLDNTGIAAQFYYPTHLAIDLNGNIFVADSNNHRIRKISPAGVVTTIAGSSSGFADGIGNNAQFSYPEGVAVDNLGNIFVADSNNHRIRKITSSGAVTTLAGSDTFGFADGNGISAKFWTPCAIALDSNGVIFVAEKQNNRIRKVLQNGDVSTFAGNGNSGSTNGTGTAAEFRNPFGIAIDVEGNIYVSDSSNNRIRKITTTGVVTTLAGSSSGYLDGIGTSAKFSYPIGISVATDGKVFVSESGGCKIRMITSTLNNNSFVLENQIVLFPNPSSSIINFELQDVILSKITIFDINNRIIDTKFSFTNQNNIDINNFQNGIYILQISTDKGIINKKIIKN